jgi:uncharacterized protein (UPF0332 family)
VKRPVQAKNLVDLGYLHDEPHSTDELDGCLSLAEGFLQVARNDRFDARVRYLNAYEAVFQVATAALRAMNLRPSQKAGSRAQSIQALAWTLDIEKAVMPILIQANRERAETTYRKTGHVVPGKQEIAALIACAQGILDAAKKRFLRGDQD